MWYNAWESVDNLERIIEKHYKMKVYHSEPMRKIIKLTTDQGEKALKIVNASYDRFLFIYEAMKHARYNGYTNIPEVIHIRNNKIGVKTKKGILAMIDWIDAHEVDYDCAFDREMATKALAKLHLAAQDFRPSHKANVRSQCGKWIEHLHERCREMKCLKKIALNKKMKSNFDKKIIQYTDYFYDLGKKSILHLEKSDYYKICKKNKKKRMFCHNDLGSANVLKTNNNQIFFIDFDNCVFDMHIFDLADFILKNVQYRPLDIHKVYAIVNIYNQINPIISESELKIIKAFMEFPHEFWMTGVRYYMRANKYSWSEEKFDMKLSRVIDNIPVMEGLLKKL